MIKQEIILRDKRKYNSGIFSSCDIENEPIAVFVGKVTARANKIESEGNKVLNISYLDDNRTGYEYGIIVYKEMISEDDKLQSSKIKSSTTN